MVEVFDSFDSDVYISKLDTKEENYTITDDETITVDNRNKKGYLPSFTIIADGPVDINGEWIINDEQILKLDSTIGMADNDELELDFDKQVYELNGDNIIEDISFPNDKIIEILEDEENEIEFSIDGTIDLTIKEIEYKDEYELHYWESFEIDDEVSFNKKKPLRSNNVTSSTKQEKDCSFTIEKMAANWNLFNYINSDDEYRIKYFEYNPDTEEEVEKFLLGVKFESWRRSASMEEFIMSNVSGFAENII